MSFQDLAMGRLQPSPSPWRAVEWGVFQVNTKVAALRQLADALGTRQDTPALRGRLRRTRAEAMRQAKNTSQALWRAAVAGDGDRDPSSKSKLAADLDAALRDLQQAQQRIIVAERRLEAAASAAAAAAAAAIHSLSGPSPPLPFPPPSHGAAAHGFADQQRAAATHFRSGPSPPSPFPHPSHGAATYGFADQQLAAAAQAQQRAASAARQELVLLDGEIAFNEAVVAEREQGILELQQDIADIHEIFRDLATLVQDQGECIDIVESDIVSAAAETGQAREELERASKTEESNSSTGCLLLVVLVLVVFIVVIVFGPVG